MNIFVTPICLGVTFLFWKGAGTMETDNKMGQEPINKLILQMSMPPLFSMFLQYSYNLVDSMFVAKINEQALAAVSCLSRLQL